MRAILPKGHTPFDELDTIDVAHISSHVNSTPRKILMGKTPYEMFHLFYADDGKELLDALGIEHICLPELFLKPKWWMKNVRKGGCCLSAGSRQRQKRVPLLKGRCAHYESRAPWSYFRVPSNPTQHTLKRAFTYL